jgi:Tfp pilus assembly protein PilF
MRLPFHWFLASGTILAVWLASAALAPAYSQYPGHQGHGDLQRLGKVDLKVSCNAAAQAEFNTGMALLHSFDWQRAMASFDAVLKGDPKCGMAHWGRAMKNGNGRYSLEQARLLVANR